MYELFEFFKALALITGILILLLIIFAVVMVFIDKITYKKRMERARNNFNKDLNELVDILAKVDVKEENNKPKTTKKPRKTKKTEKDVK